MAPTDSPAHADDERLAAAGITPPPELSSEDRLLVELEEVRDQARTAIDGGRPDLATALALVGILDLVIATVREDGLP